MCLTHPGTPSPPHAGPEQPAQGLGQERGLERVRDSIEQGVHLGVIKIIVGKENQKAF